MMRSLLFLFALAACGRGSTPQADARERDSGAAQVSDSVVLESVAEGLEVPWAIAFAPDGRIFVSERRGTIRVVDHGQLREWAGLHVFNDGEAGLLGLALAPDFTTSHAVYVAATVGNEQHLETQVIRLVERNGMGVDPRVIVRGIPSGFVHAGTGVAFGPDGMIYVGTGDGQEPARAHDPSSLGGKILRFTPDGGIPADNPTPGSPVWASGVRNPQALTWDPATGQLFATDHGPSGFANERFRRDNDEINAIVRGGDFGWPAHAGYSADAAYVPPIAHFVPAIAPSGMAFYAGTTVPEWQSSLFVGALRGERLVRIRVRRDRSARAGWQTEAITPMFARRLGRIRAVAVGPDGFVYFTTSNRDGRGTPRPGDDHLYRIRPAR